MVHPIRYKKVIVPKVHTIMYLNSLSNALYLLQLVVSAHLGLDLAFKGVKDVDHTFVQGLAGGSAIDGRLVARNGTLFANSSTEKQMYGFGNTCEYNICILTKWVFKPRIKLMLNFAPI